MKKFTDGNRMIEVEMKLFDGTNLTADLSSDFFGTGDLPFDESKDAYVVDDIDYLIDNVKSWEEYSEAFGGGEEAREHEKEIGVERVTYISEINLLAKGKESELDCDFEI